ncbi:hypothetical protein EZV62_027525 [Acer yangbiense]|uniref:Uncharacterized protein n=1 Tax=Acer yangbiense TaxID=1000413 RepID=A0A5C7GTW9_9ROSI|nr:hypothetical protein EZV62_027525 [Acer yangbiense]
MLLGAVVPVQTRVTLAFAFIFFFLIVFSERADNDSPVKCSRTCLAQNCNSVGIRYGKPCGVEWTGCPGEKPCDDLDACCKNYDECVEKKEIGISEVSESKQENVEDIIKNQQLDNQLKEIIVELRKNNEEIIKKLQETVQKSWEKVRTEFEKRSGFHAASIIQKAAQDSLEKNRKEAAQQLKTTPENEKPKDTNDHEAAKRNTINPHNNLLHLFDGSRPQG